MAGLNSLLSDTQQTTTTMPSWYDAAQQKIVSQGASALQNAPTMGQTVAQGAIHQLEPGNNPFVTAGATMQGIASGAANPWITDAHGQVKPNTNTAMGGLFQAENQQLNQLLPSTTAPAQGNAIASGNFGSLRGQTAVDKAKADAFSTLNAQQLAAALQNQQTGVSAGTAVGNLANQNINASMNVGQAQMNEPFQNIGNYASLIGTLQAPTTVSSQKQLAPLGQLSTIGNAATGALSGLSGLANSTAGKNILNSLGLGGLFGTSGSSANAGSGLSIDSQGNLSTGTYPTADGGTITINGDGSKSIKAPDGTVQNFDPSGNAFNDATNSGNPAPVIDPSLPTDSQGNIDYSGDNWGGG